MADRIYMGRMKSVGQAGFAEAARGFNENNGPGGLNPFEVLFEILSQRGEVSRTDKEIWVHGAGAWVRITQEGELEIGSSAT